jgi:NAD-dependent deacetylase
VSESALARAATILRTAKRVVVFTGAGMSADNGIPTFRTGRNKAWGGARMEQFATLDGYRANLKYAWAWYDARATTARATEPHAGYDAIRRLAERVDHLAVVTQNVDGLHRRAGSSNVLELHGNLREVRCLDCARHLPWPTVSVEEPRCECGGPLCPNVVLFGEDLPPRAWNSAIDAAKHCDVLLSIGTSHQVYPAAGIPSLVSDRFKPVIVVNTRAVDSLPFGLFIRGRAARVLPALVDAAWAK